MAIPVTILYGSISALVTLALAANVSLYRVWFHVWLGKPIPDTLHLRVRAHGNAAEWFAPTILALAFLELQHAPSFWLHMLGGGMLATRLFHATFMLLRKRLSVASATVMYTLGFVTAGWALFLRLRG